MAAVVNAILCMNPAIVELLKTHHQKICEIDEDTIEIHGDMGRFFA